MRKAFDACRELFDHHQRFVLTTHVNPDPDAIGSEIALASFLRSRGKDVAILNHNATPSNCLFLDPEKTISQFIPERHAAIVANTEVIVVLDANQTERLQSLQPYIEKSGAKKLCIDHHPDCQPFADLYVVDEDAAATGEILHNLLVHCDPECISKEIATALYAAIMTDTGSFRFPKTDAALHCVVAGLIERGADPTQIYFETYEQGSANRLQLLGNVLSTLQLAHNGRVASVFVTKDMFTKTETTEEDIENFVTYTLPIAGVQVGLMFTELTEGVKISFRSRGDIAVNKLAQEFGGNGHKNAAGARTNTQDLGTVIDEVVERTKSYLV